MFNPWWRGFYFSSSGHLARHACGFEGSQRHSETGRRLGAVAGELTCNGLVTIDYGSRGSVMVVSGYCCKL